MIRKQIKNSNLLLVKKGSESSKDPYYVSPRSNVSVLVSDSKVTEVDVDSVGGWGLYCSTFYCTEDQIYTMEERRAILGLLKVLSAGPVPILLFEESVALIYASGDRELIDEYEERYSKSVGSAWLHSICKFINPEKEISASYYRREFSRSYTIDEAEYTITDLVDDLVADRSKILVDSELLGKYSRISREVIDKNSSVRVNFEMWNPIVKKTTNSTRANLSLTYSVPISIEVPENTFNVVSGRRELTSLRSFCLVRDGELWSSKLAVKVNSSDLKEKLARSSSFILNILEDDEFYLDLTVLPISHAQTLSRGVQVLREKIVEAEESIYEEDIILDYLVKVDYMRRKDLSLLPESLEKEEKTDGEKFLESLGIYGGLYIPKQTKIARESKEYTVSTLVTELFPILDKKERGRNLREYINTGLCTSSSINRILGSISNFDLEWHRKHLGELKSTRNDLVFKLLSIKDTLVPDQTVSRFSGLSGKMRIREKGISA